MSTRTRLAAFLTAAIAVFVLALGLGSRFTPIAGSSSAAPAPTRSTLGTASLGTAATQDGLRLELLTPVLRTTQGPELNFRIVDDATRKPVTAFVNTHTRPLHLILARTDLSHYRHVHPTMANDGRWSVRVSLPSAGTWRMYTDFRAGGRPEPMTLSTTVEVGGPTPAPTTLRPANSAIVDAYRLDLRGRLTAAETAEVEIKVARGGAPVNDLQDYLGAAGHLVALRVGDGAYLHVHPVDAKSRGPGVRFAVEVPSAGRYRLFLDFRHNNIVRTAAFTLDAGPTGRADARVPTTTGHDGH